jgi:putative transposase
MLAVHKRIALPFGIETMHMISKGQMKNNGITRTAATQLYSLVS